MEISRFADFFIKISSVGIVALPGSLLLFIGLAEICGWIELKGFHSVILVYLFAFLNFIHVFTFGCRSGISNSSNIILKPVDLFLAYIAFMLAIFPFSFTETMIFYFIYKYQDIEAWLIFMAVFTPLLLFAIIAPLFLWITCCWIFITTACGRPVMFIRAFKLHSRHTAAGMLVFPLSVVLFFALWIDYGLPQTFAGFTVSLDGLLLQAAICAFLFRIGRRYGAFYGEHILKAGPLSVSDK